MDDYEIKNGSSASVDARYNYWGSAVISEMATGDNPKNIKFVENISDIISYGALKKVL